MYLHHFGLREEPFGATPDPRFLYLSHTHREAMASLEYRVNAGCGFIALVSLPGMGKTTLLFQLLQSLRSRAETAFIFQTQCGSRELMRQLLSELRWGVECGNDLVAILNQFKLGMLRTAAAGKRVVIVIDEAQNLTPEVLESVRLLSNFETPRAKLVQIILSGQPRLAKTLNRPELSQLRQRITIANRLEPLRPADVQGYVDHRLRAAGYSGEGLFSTSAFRSLAEGSRGIPRIINNLCFNALSMGFALDRRYITKSVVEEVLADLNMSAQLEEYDGVSETPDLSEMPNLEPPKDVVSSAPREPFAEAFSAQAYSIPMPESLTEQYQHSSTSGWEELRSGVSPANGIQSGDDQPSRNEIYPSSETVNLSATTREPAPRVGNRDRDVLARPSAQLGSPSLRRGATVVFSILLVASLVLLLARFESRSGSDTATVSASAKTVPPAPPNPSTEQPRTNTVDSTARLGRSAKSSARPKEHQRKPENIIVPNAGDGRVPHEDESIEVPAPGIQKLTNSENLSALPIAVLKTPTFPPPSVGQHSSSFEPPRLLDSQSLKYPPAARAARVEGVVTLKATISATGKVERVNLIDGPMVLASTTLDSVKHWRYEPASVDGKPVVSETTVTVKYRLDPTGER
jgi:TonB family protein